MAPLLPPGATPMLTSSEVAELCRVDARTVTQWHRTHVLRGIRPAGTKRILFPADKVRAFLESDIYRAERDKAGEDVAA